MEEWRDITEYEGVYQVSSLGRVRSLDRIVRASGPVPARKHQGRVLSAADNGKGYLHLSLAKNGTIKTHRVCRLVAAAFHGSCPEGKECAHLDGTRNNDIPENLRWVTPSENMLHMHEHGTRLTKLNESDVVEIKKRYTNGETKRKISLDYPVSDVTIGGIVNGKVWSHV